MKKSLLMMLSAMISIATLCGCNIFNEDDNHAIVEVVTSNGRVVLGQSYNGSGSTYSSQSIVTGNKVELHLQYEEEEVLIRFTCEACDTVKEYRIDGPFSKKIHCECSDDMDENGNVKEYFAVVVDYGKDGE